MLLIAKRNDPVTMWRADAPTIESCTLDQEKIENERAAKIRDFLYRGQ